MTHALIKHVQKQHLRNHPEIRTGYTVRIHQKIKEGAKERVQLFEGLVIKVNSGHGIDKTFTVRKIVSGIGVEKIFPFNSGTIQKIEVLKIAKVRRAKLYFMRDRAGKSARLKETHVNILGDMSLLHAEKPEEMAAEETPMAAEETPTEEV
ncbi:50S ribosomal protein L19 [Candidatus Peregrinibacteria bacterium CG11_big_fil_rev_8_21_14_0_20_41_10]|nr:MAG: 50S ribosomal protein L19 [Candidatus Peregrinibacteria bacterium CG11_big_fil_rev_8_21_14_0_20_41_10]PIZ75801.1 MAG: 50S ribosomal protein L19 [Candidatus Peregrinibacteria bacterium CG_4_10_14_0_2_um_filter_41_8]PJC38258.1 MAG: 50S ribosomal protein L19 [Candidatus Peregrinibacteria bacterium CG_4_9_14_0_2_um_filter_41_14]